MPGPGRVLVAGRAAELLDTEHAIGARLPWALGTIAVAALMLLLVMTDSVLLPIKAVVVAALGLTAAFGALVWVFQDGHLAGVLGFTPTGTTETSLPVLMFCLAFGLSMDYGVFLLSRIKEEYDRTGDNRTAVASGLSHTGGVVTAAAVVLAVVLGCVGTSSIVNNKVLGIGGALAIVMDATVIRCLLVPSVMALAGPATWWTPPRLHRLLRPGRGRQRLYGSTPRA
jgi:RND superfamily putative drug exporter